MKEQESIFIDDLGNLFDPLDPSVTLLIGEPTGYLTALEEHPDGYWKEPGPDPLPIEVTCSEMGDLMEWLCQENGKRFDKHQNPLAMVQCHNGRVEVTRGATGVVTSNKVGRNDPCPCGKIKADGTKFKYKHCCGK